MAQKKTTETVDYSGDTRYVVFGWCSTGQDKSCRVEFNGHRCSCDCHQEEEIGNDNMV
jgi:hypothetical protein